MVILKVFRSLFGFATLIIREATEAVAAAIRRDRDVASDHTKKLLTYMHDEVLAILVALQRRLGFCPVPSNDLDRILIIKLDRIGDMVNATPVFDALHSLFPKARLDIVGHPGPLSLVVTDQRIKDRFVYCSSLYHRLPNRLPDLKNWTLILKLLRTRYPLVVYLRGSWPFLLFALTSRLAATKFVVGEPVIERYLKPLALMYGSISRVRTRLCVESEAARYVEAKIFATRVGPRIAIQATSNANTRQWPKERFAHLADELRERFGADIHFIGSPHERKKLEAIDALSRLRHAFHWSLTLSQATAAIAACDLLIGNESGLVHVAAAVGTPCIVLWGSANLNMCRPDGPPERCTVIYHELSCRLTCRESYCVNPSNLDCLRRIQVVDVVEAARRHLERSGFPCKRASATGAASHNPDAQLVHA
jgi:ADP-heptose:LPS heptosyltransferase